MKTTPSLLLAVGLSAVGAMTAITTHAASVLTFSDTFDAADSNDVNSQNNAGRQTGAAGVLGYLENVTGPNDPLSRLGGNLLRLEGTADNAYTAVTPNHNFNEGGNFTIEFDLDAGVNDLANSSGDWACIVFGSSAAGPVFVNASDGMGILFRNTGGIQVFDGGTAVSSSGALPLGRMHVRIEVESGGFGLGTPATIRMFVDGNEVQIGANTLEHVKTTGFPGNYITLGGSAFGNNWIHEFDNFSVSATPCVRPSINALNSYVGQNSQTVSVSIPPSLNTGGAVDVVVISSDRAVAEPAGATAGSVTLNFPPGTTTRSYTIAAHQNGTATFSLSTTAAGACVEGATVVTVGATLVKNPGFEENFNPAFPGYSPIASWTAIPGGGTGVNESNGPFHDNSTIPDRARVALHQGSGGIRQFISGLQPGREHWLQFRYNKRQGGLMALRTVFAGVELDNIASIPVAGANPYHFRHIAFTPATDSGDLEFRTAATGDATALLDGVTIIARGPNQVVVQNPSFEASGFVPGEQISPAALSGWAGTGTYGVARSGSGVADNGVNPDQEGVGYIQGISSISQTINNLVVGQEYRISYSCNVSAASFGGSLRVSMGGSVLNEEALTAVDNGPYLRRTNSWVATSASAALLFESLDDLGNPAILLDDIQILGLSLPPCETTVSVEKFELVANQPVGPNVINVGLPLYLVATSSVQVVIISQNPNVAIPTGAAVDRITLTYPQGNTTNRSFSITGVGSGITTFLVVSPDSCASTSFTVRNRTTLVLNPSFEANSLPAFPGYGQIDDWIGGSGVNDNTQPFADNGGIPDRTQIGFIQGGGNLSQIIGGLTPGQPYWVQFGYNTRNCCSDPGQFPLHLVVRFAGSDIGGVSNITAGSYQAATFRFTPTNTFGTLEFAALLPAGGDRTTLLDAVNIVARAPEDAVVLNASFEGTGLVPVPGTVQPTSIGGWAGAGSYGVNVSGAGPFADNGRNPDQDSVAFLQGENSSLTTLVNALEFGATYRLSYSYNARSGNTPHLRVTVNDAVAQDADVAPAGGVAPYPTHEYSFTATGSVATIAFTQTGAGDQTVLLDNVRVVQTSPGGVRLRITRFDATTVRVSWPISAAGFTLRAASSLPGAWVDEGWPVADEGDEHAVYDTASGTKFYRLSNP